MNPTAPDPNETLVSDKPVVNDTDLLKAILALEVGQIANVVQAAAELPGDLHDRLWKAYDEIAGPAGMVGWVD